MASFFDVRGMLADVTGFKKSWLLVRMLVSCNVLMRRNLFAWFLFVVVSLGLCVFRWGRLPGEYYQWVQWELAWCLSLAITGAFMYLASVYLQNRYDVLRREGVFLLALIPFALAVHLLEPHFLKVAFDEQAHLGVAYGMYSQGRCEVPLAAHLNFSGEPAIDLYGNTFRGYYFSVLVAVIARVVGFSEVIVFWLNGAVAFGVLCVVYAISRRLGLLPGYALVPAVLLLGTTIYGQVMCSGSYDLINLLCLSIFIWFFVDFIEMKSLESGRLFLLVALLLSYCRTESLAYYVLAVGVWLFVMRWRVRWELILSLLCTLPVLATHYVLMSNPRNITQGAIRPDQSVWSLSNLYENWQDSVVYFLNLSPTGSGSCLLFFLGMAGFIVILARVLTGRLSLARSEWALWVVAGVSIMLYSVVMGSFWGGPSVKLVMTRFTLPLWLMLAIGAAYALKFLILRAWFSVRIAWMVVISWFIIFVMPSHARRDVVMSFDVGLADRKMIEMAKAIDDGRTLFVYESCASFVSRGLPCVEYAYFIKHLQRYVVLAKTGAWSRVVFVEPVRLLTPDGRRIERRPKWGEGRDTLITKEVAGFYYDSGWKLCLDEWVGVRLATEVQDVRIRDGEFPPHSNHHELMFRLRSLMPREE